MCGGVTNNPNNKPFSHINNIGDGDEKLVHDAVLNHTDVLLMVRGRVK